MNATLNNLVRELDEKQVPYKIIELSDKAMTVPDVIRFAKEPVNPDEICKTIMIAVGDQFFGAMLKGNDRIDFTRLKEFTKTRARFATAEEVLATANVEPGAVCPLLLNVPLLIDTKILELKKAHFGSGDHLFGLEISPKDLVKLRPADIVPMSKSEL